MKIQLVDPKALNLSALADFEDAAGVGLFEVYDKIVASGGLTELRIRTLIALVWVCARHTNPAFTLEDAGRVHPDDIEFAMPDPAPDG